MGDLDRALPALHHALRTLHLPDGPFADALPARLLLDVRDLPAVRRAAVDDGHDTAWALPLRDGRPEAAWAVALAEPEEDDLRGAHVLLARDGAWAVISTGGGAALLGGPPALVAAVRGAVDGDEAERFRRWARWGEGWEAGLAGHLGLDPPGDPLAETLADEGELRLEAAPADPGATLRLLGPGPHVVAQVEHGRDRYADVLRLEAEVRGAAAGRRPWFAVRCPDGTVVEAGGGPSIGLRVDRPSAIARLHRAAAPAGLRAHRWYAPHVAVPLDRLCDDSRPPEDPLTAVWRTLGVAATDPEGETDLTIPGRPDRVVDALLGLGAARSGSRATDLRTGRPIRVRGLLAAAHAVAAGRDAPFVFRLRTDVHPDLLRVLVDPGLVTIELPGGGWSPGRLHAFLAALARAVAPLPLVTGDARTDAALRRLG